MTCGSTAKRTSCHHEPPAARTPSIGSGLMFSFTSVQLLYFSDAGAILLIIVATIMAIDMLSENFRHRAIGKASFAH